MMHNANNYNNAQIQDLTFWQSCSSAGLAGLISYIGSFSVVPLTFTMMAIVFGTQSSVTSIATAFSMPLAGYLHTHASKTGISLVKDLFGGFYISEIKNRRQGRETVQEGLQRYFCEHKFNALVLNLMWESFTMFYFIQSALVISYIQFGESINLDDLQGNMTMPSVINHELEHRVILVLGITHFLAGCLSGITTGIINHLWQRILAHGPEPLAHFETERERLHVNWQKRKELLSPFNMENWIKAFTMFTGALFIIVSNIPNITKLHLLNVHLKRFISDFLVIHGGWLFIRDILMFFMIPIDENPRERPVEQAVEQMEMLPVEQAVEQMEMLPVEQAVEQMEMLPVEQAVEQSPLLSDTA